MALETGTYISDLVATNPASGDPKSQGDDHLRLVKATVKATFPNLYGAVTPTHTELNYVDGVTSAIQAQIDSKGAHTGQAWTGAQNFTGATTTVVTQAVGDSSTKAASTAFVAAQAFAAALPAQTGNTGKLVTTDGTTASWSAIGTALQLLRVNAAGTGVEGVAANPQWAIKTAAYTAVSGDAIQADTTAGAFTLTLPASPAANDLVRIADYAGTFATNNLTVGRNGSNIMGLAEDMTVSTNNVSLVLTYIDAAQGWRIV